MQIKSFGSRTIASAGLIALASTLLTPQSVSAQAVWGSFDASRINYSGGVLNTGGEHSTLRNIIQANNGTLGPDTGTLTAAYLATVDVFYTSLLSTSTGVLSAAEQTALQDWITDGGTLIVTADIFPLPAYESFTSFYGVTGYTALSNSGNGNVLNAHPITAGVNTYTYVTNSTYVYGGDALLLGDDGFGSDYMIVMEPDTCFTGGGRILVFGDHNMFTNTYIVQTDTTALATNMSLWAADPPPHLSQAGPCPGSITFTSRNNTPGGRVAFIRAFGMGNVLIPPGTVCGGMTLCLNNTATLGGLTTANANGTATITANVPAGACGNVYVQTLDITTCRMSNVIAL